MMEMGMEEHKVFYTVEEIASDLCIRKGEAAELVKKMHRELKAAGKLTIAGNVPSAWYERQKEESFLEGWQQPEHIPLTEKRLLNLKEFCTDSGMGQHMAREFAKGTGIEKRIGHKVLYDRVLFDRWCNKNKAFGL